MKPSLSSPEYSVYIVSGSTKYNVTTALIAVDRSEEKKELAQSVTISLANINVGNSKLSDLIGIRDRVFVYANDGSIKEEVFRGFIWAKEHETSIDDNNLKYKCYDQLIYLQESEVSEFFSPGYSSESVIKKLCENWGIKLNYSYYLIVHEKLALRGYLADIMMSDVLDLVKDRTGHDYVMRSEKDVLCVRTVGKNKTIYKIVEDNNAISASTEITMNGLVTKVVVVGSGSDDEREPVEATVYGKFSQYGTLQKIVRRDSNTDIDSAKKEAKNIIAKDGKPKVSYRVKAPDIPWIRKGDKVFVNAGSIKKKYLIVDDIDRTFDATKKEMTLTLSDA